MIENMSIEEVLKLIDKMHAIVLRAANNSCCICCDKCLACDANDIIREMKAK